MTSTHKIREAKLQLVKEWLLRFTPYETADKCVKAFNCRPITARIYVRECGGYFNTKKYIERQRRLDQVKTWLSDTPQREIYGKAIDDFGCSRRRAKEYVRDVLLSNPGLDTVASRWRRENGFKGWPEHRDLILKIVSANPGLTTQQIIQMEWVDLWTTFSTGPRLHELYLDGKVTRNKQDGATGPFIWFRREA